MTSDWKPSAGGGSAGLEVDNFDEAIELLKAEAVAFIWSRWSAGLPYGRRGRSGRQLGDDPSEENRTLTFVDLMTGIKKLAASLQ